MSITYTKHSKTKFEVLKKHGFELTENQVEDVILNPDDVISAEGETFIAQKSIDETHLLRVIYRT